MSSASLKGTATELWRDGRGWILLTVGAGWFLSLGARLVYPAIVPFLREDFGLSLSMAGLLLTLLWAAYAIGQFPGGVLGDRVGEGNILVFSTALSAVTILTVSLSPNLLTLFLATMAFGFATALFGPTRFTIFTNIYTNHAGTAVGLTMSAGSVGNTLLPAIAGILAGALTWRLGLGMLVPLFAASAIALHLSVPGYVSERTSAVDDISMDTIRRILDGVTQGVIPAVVAIQVFMSFVFQAFVGLYPTYLVASKDLSTGVAAILFGLFFAVGAILQPIAGASMNTYGPRPVLLVVLTTAVVSLGTLPFVTGLWVLVPVTVFLGSLGAYGTVTQTSISDALPEEMQGTGLGLLRTSWMLIGATGPVILGVLGDFGLFDEGFLMLAAIACGGLAITALVMGRATSA